MSAFILLCAIAVAPRGSVEKALPDAGAPSFSGEQLPLQLAVRSPEDLVFKAAVEKQYLVFNLLAGGKVAWDRGDFASAATRWETLLRTPGLPAELEALVQPLARNARERAGSIPVTGAALPIEQSPAPGVTMTPMEPAPPDERRTTTLTVAGTVNGGGTHGPGGAVAVLRRADGSTPRPRATRVRAVVQKDKRFVPHVLAVPVGATVEFRNDDEIFHNVFSLTKPNEFDLGLYKSGAAREQVFSSPGPVHLLCNIHSSMNGYVYVVDSPWFAQADANGRFAIKSVPPGQYELEVWHEWSAKTVRTPVKVSPGMSEVAVTVDGDRRAPAFVPDKSGKPRQPQLGY